MMKNNEIKPSCPYKPVIDALGRVLNDPPFKIDDELALKSILELDFEENEMKNHLTKLNNNTMSCKHRFYDELIPDWSIEHLFVGTFNPSWNKESSNNAVYFYSRYTNDFWYIMPQVFGCQSLMKKEDRTNPSKLKDFLREHKIGITDMIATVKNADEENHQHKKWILSFLDNDLEHFEFEATKIEDIIKRNPQLKGIYLTRQLSESKGSSVKDLWNHITKIASTKGIKTCELVTPSRAYHSIKRDQKVKEWKSKIF